MQIRWRFKPPDFFPFNASYEWNLEVDMETEGKPSKRIKEQRKETKYGRTARAYR
jgi:hypothetical protein